MELVTSLPQNRDLRQWQMSRVVQLLILILLQICLVENQRVFICNSNDFNHCCKKHKKNKLHNCVRLSYATSMENVREGLERLERFSSELK